MIVSRTNSWSSLRELKEHLTASRSVLIGEEAQSAKRFLSFSVVCGGEESLVGVQSSDFGIAAQAVPIEGSSRLIVGHDCEAVVLDIERICVVEHHELEGPFYKFLMDGSGRTFVVHELGVLALNERGARLWSFDAKDIVSDCVLQRDRLQLSVTGIRLPVVLESSTGALI